jgi:penicillin amidase
MKVFKFYISIVITLALIYSLNRSWVVDGNRLPPLGKFLDPFHGFWQNIESDDVAFPTELDIPGLKDKVTVVYDSLSIPHIFANNDEDLYLAQGYVTAMDRLWQMEFQTLAAAGRISEVIGEGKNGFAINFDRGQRRRGLTFGAMNALSSMESDAISKMMVTQYSNGINQYIKTLSYDNLPFEYKLLDYEPEDWAPIKCGFLLMNMAKTLSMSEKDIEMSNALKLFGRETLEILYPDTDIVGDPIVDKPGEWKFDPVRIDSVPLALPKELIALDRLPRENPTTGSNNWAVDGSKTATGSPILCGDPHLELSLPSIWYAVQLNAPGVNTMGASLPGAPAIVIGFNDSIAWSVTNAQRDVVDWYSISFEDAKRNRYRLDDKWVDTKKVVEAFAIRGQEIFYDTIIYTKWGPVTYDATYHASDNRKGYSFRWTAHDPSHEVVALYKLNRANNHDDYMKALDHFLSPPQNFAFASVAGDIAMRIQGKYPVRRNQEGRFALDGSKSSNGWQAFIPNDQNVTDKNPKRGFVSSANQFPVDATYPYYVTGESYEGYRNRRINKVLRESKNVTVTDMMKLQGDNYNLKAEESLPTFLSYLDTAKLNADELDAYHILRSWDYVNTADSEGASYYESWWDNLMPLIWDEMQNPEALLIRPTTFNTIKLIREKPDLVFFDLKTTPEKENAGDILRMAFKFGVEDILKWKSNNPNAGDEVPWADFKDSYVGHVLRIAPLSIHVKHGGNEGIVNAHSQTHGPSWRMIVSLEKSGVKTWATYPGGQSGNPGNIHYSDMLDRWVSDQYYKLLFMHKADDSNGKIFSTTQLNPAK